MPWGSLVFGSAFYPGRARVRRRHRGTVREDYDGVECLFAFLVPLVPLRPVHVWDWGLDETTGTGLSAVRTAVYSYRAVPIRWSPDLVLRTLLRYWLWPPLVVGLLFALSCAHGVLFRLAGLALLLASLGAWLALAFTGGQRAVRRLLGRHRLGVSDPATWTEDLVRLLAPPREWFGTSTFAGAVDPLLEQGRYSEAMWAARLCLATESEVEGRALTDRVLHDPEVRAVVARVESHPGGFKELAGRQHPREFPLLRPGTGRAAAYWYSVVADRSRETLEVVAYREHAAGELRETRRVGPRPPTDQLGPRTVWYRLGGFALVAAVVLGLTGFVASSTLFRERTAAEEMIAEQQRQIAAQQPAAAARQPAAPPGQPNPPAKQPPPPAWARSEPGDWRYLADMPEFDAVVAAPWAFAKDGTTGDPEKRSPIRVGGFASPRGLGMHPPERGHASVKYRLDRRAERFKSVGAVSDSSTILFSPLAFEVWGDGRRLWESERITDGRQTRECVIDVSGVGVLELRAAAVGHHTGLHAVWLEPRVLMK